MKYFFKRALFFALTTIPVLSTTQTSTTTSLPLAQSTLWTSNPLENNDTTNPYKTLEPLLITSAYTNQTVFIQRVDSNGQIIFTNEVIDLDGNDMSFVFYLLETPRALNKYFLVAQARNADIQAEYYPVKWNGTGLEIYKESTRMKVLESFDPQSLSFVNFALQVQTDSNKNLLFQGFSGNNLDQKIGYISVGAPIVGASASPITTLSLQFSPTTSDQSNFKISKLADLSSVDSTLDSILSKSSDKKDTTEDIKTLLTTISFISKLAYHEDMPSKIINLLKKMQSKLFNASGAVNPNLSNNELFLDVLDKDGTTPLLDSFLQPFFNGEIANLTTQAIATLRSIKTNFLDNPKAQRYTKKLDAEKTAKIVNLQTSTNDANTLDKFIPLLKAYLNPQNWFLDDATQDLISSDDRISNTFVAGFESAIQKIKVFLDDSANLKPDNAAKFKQLQNLLAGLVSAVLPQVLFKKIYITSEIVSNPQGVWSILTDSKFDPSSLQSLQSSLKNLKSSKLDLEPQQLKDANKLKILNSLVTVAQVWKKTVNIQTLLNPPAAAPAPQTTKAVAPTATNTSSYNFNVILPSAKVSTKKSFLN